jgi:hypothetical protein
MNAKQGGTAIMIRREKTGPPKQSANDGPIDRIEIFDTSHRLKLSFIIILHGRDFEIIHRACSPLTGIGEILVEFPELFGLDKRDIVCRHDDPLAPWKAEKIWADEMEKIRSGPTRE